MRVQTPYGELRIDAAVVDVSSSLRASMMPREFAPGRTSYTLNGEPISEERAEEILAEIRA